MKNKDPYDGKIMQFNISPVVVISQLDTQNVLNHLKRPANSKISNSTAQANISKSQTSEVRKIDVIKKSVISCLLCKGPFELELEADQNQIEHNFLMYNRVVINLNAWNFDHSLPRPTVTTTASNSKSKSNENNSQSLCLKCNEDISRISKFQQEIQTLRSQINDVLHLIRLSTLPVNVPRTRNANDTTTEIEAVNNTEKLSKELNMSENNKIKNLPSGSGGLSSSGPGRRSLRLQKHSKAKTSKLECKSKAKSAIVPEIVKSTETSTENNLEPDIVEITLYDANEDETMEEVNDHSKTENQLEETIFIEDDDDESHKEEPSDSDNFQSGLDEDDENIDSADSDSDESYCPAKIIPEYIKNFKDTKISESDRNSQAGGTAAAEKPLEQHRPYYVYPCVICEEPFPTREELAQHRTITNNKCIPKKDQPKESAICEICGTICANIKALATHKIHHGKPSKPENPSKSAICDVCGKVCVNIQALAWHKRIHQEKQPKSPLPCDICDKIFNSNPALKHHMDYVHLGKRKRVKLREEIICPSTCHICGKVSKNPDSLKGHIRLNHVMTKRFKCMEEGCSYAFKTSGMLKKHMWSHRKEKNFQCETCGKRFCRNYVLVAHVKKGICFKPTKDRKNKKKQTFYPRKKFPCPFCERRLSRKEVLEFHIKKVHASSSNLQGPVEDRSQMVEIPSQSQVVEIQAQSQVVEIPSQSQVVKIQAQNQVVEIPSQRQVVEIQAQNQVVEIPSQRQVVEIQAQNQVVEIEAESEVVEAEVDNFNVDFIDACIEQLKVGIPE